MRADRPHNWRWSLLIASASLAVLGSSCDFSGYCIDCYEPGEVDAAAVDGGGGDGGGDAGSLFDAGPPADACMATGAETCDGFDNDCDGMIDEGDLPGEGAVCSNNMGECTEGVTDCADGEIVCAGGVLPTLELCDTLDNDCDGVADNGNPEGGMPCGVDTGECVSGVTQCNGGAVECQGNVDPVDEICDSRDNDCDGLFDEDVPLGGSCGPTQGDTGECALGTDTCIGGVFQCVGAVYPTLEQCDGNPDIVDHDCDDDPLNGFDLNTNTQHCGMCNNACAANNAITTCAGGTCSIAACQPDYFDNNGMYSDGCEFFCDTFTGPQEACNGLDDDCDGMVDENLIPPEVCDGMMNCSDVCDLPNECSGTVSACVNGAWTCPWGPTVEVDGMGNLLIQETLCDGLDNDCDGLADESYPNKGDVCFDNGLGICQRQGTFECNGTQDGLECANLSPVVMGQPETCNGLDDDCNGTIDDGASTGDLHDWVDIGGGIEIFAYEASRPDAGGMSNGAIDTHACSNPGVLPWNNVTYPQAEAACAAIGARLCTETEWQSACQGPVPATTVQDPGADGIAVVEAENFTLNTPQGSHAWTLNAAVAGYSGTGAMEATPNSGTNNNTGYVANSPRLDFDIDFVFTGTHYLWVRGYGPSGSDDSCHGGIDGAAPASADRIGSFNSSWTWRNIDMDNGNVTINVPTTGVHTVNIWMREDGFLIDKVLLTTNPGFTPTGEGPSEACDWSYASNCNTYQPDTCNGDDHDPIAGAPDDDLLQTTANMTMCRADWAGGGAVFDLSGNVKEWTQARAPGVNPLRGGAFDTPGVGMQCDFDFTIAGDNFLYPNVGFRCCRGP